MLIPLTPVKRRCVNPAVSKGLKIEGLFPFLSGGQALFGSAREALYHGLCLLEDKPRRIHLPAYCCKSVLLPLTRLGIEVRFYDVGDRLEPVLNRNDFSRGDLFLLIHFFGIPQDALYYDKLCSEFGMLLIEDCAHTLPDPDADMPMGTTGIFSIYSLRKMLPVPDGGVLLGNAPAFKTRMAKIPHYVNKRLSWKRWGVTSLDRFANSFGWPNTLVLKDRLRRRFNSSDTAFNERLSPDAIPEVNLVTSRLLNEFNVKAIRDERLRNYMMLSGLLSCVSGINIPLASLPGGAFPQAFPIISKASDKLCGYLRAKGVGAGKWPDLELPESLDLSRFPGASSWVNSLLLLPSHQDIGFKEIDYITKTMKEGIA
ncbi:MAG: DegT/DnrJ/EryC1/StrS family aminotransferase [Nitrospirae bacterium]|nr:DegT/DnrJ/EryC1/StrS family aminotransferase [Nitrospirota bacterium]